MIETRSTGRRTWVDIYSEGSWDTSFQSPSRVALTFDRYHLRNFRRVATAEGAETLRVADLGCGDLGNTLYFLSQGYDITAVDIWESPAVAEVKAAYPSFKFVSCDLREWQSDNIFDAILSDASLYYSSFDDFFKICVNLRRHLKRRSCFRFSVKELNDLLVKRAPTKIKRSEGIVEMTATDGWEAGLPILAFSAYAFQSTCTTLFPDFNLKFGFDFFHYADLDQSAGHRFLIVTGERAL